MWCHERKILLLPSKVSSECHYRTKTHDRHLVCHPERSMKARLYGVVLQMPLFGISYGVEVLRSVIEWSGAKPPQAGSPMGFLNVCSALVTFFNISHTASFKCNFVQASVSKPSGDPFLGRAQDARPRRFWIGSRQPCRSLSKTSTSLHFTALR